MDKTMIGRAALVAGALCLGPAAAGAETYLAANYLPDGSPNGRFLNDWTRRIAEKTGGEVDFEVYNGGSLLPAAGSLSGLQSHVADLVLLTGSLTPSDLPMDNVLSDTAFLSDDQMVLAFATLETKMTHPAMREEYREANIVYGAGMAIGLYNFMCAVPIETLADLEGRRVRTTTGAHINWVTELGGVSVNVPAPDIYPGMQRKSLDCLVGTPLFLTEYFSLSEVTDSVLRLDMGSIDTGGFFYNGDFWASLDPDERRAAMDAAAEAQAAIYVDWAERTEAAFQAVRDEGGTLVEPTAEDVARFAEYQARYLEELPETSAERYGIDAPGDLIDAYIAAQEKWAGLLSEIDRTDVEAVTALIKREIFDTVDVETYGLD